MLKNGTPSEETFLWVIRLLDPNQFERCFHAWVCHLISKLSGAIAVDSKTVRGSGSGGETAIQMVSAFASQLYLVLGQEKISSKYNEITAIPVLLDTLYLKGFLVSIDAMRCERTIAEKIISKKANYLMVLKENQPSLHKAIQDTILDSANKVAHSEQVEQGQARIVAQRRSVLPGVRIVSERN